MNRKQIAVPGGLLQGLPLSVDFKKLNSLVKPASLYKSGGFLI